MKIAVLGAGAGGTAMAFDCAVHGHEVRLFDFPDFPDNIATVASQGGIHAKGDIAGFGDIAYAGHDIDAALQDAELIYVVGPAYSTEPFGAAVKGKLQAGQTAQELLKTADEAMYQAKRGGRDRVEVAR